LNYLEHGGDRGDNSTAEGPGAHSDCGAAYGGGYRAQAVTYPNPVREVRPGYYLPFFPRLALTARSHRQTAQRCAWDKLQDGVRAAICRPAELSVDPDAPTVERHCSSLLGLLHCVIASVSALARDFDRQCKRSNFRAASKRLNSFSPAYP